MKRKSSSPNDHERADKTRQKILHAAVREFSRHGLAGARTDAIAESAKVNKALLYYYFKSKSSLYAAALEDAASKVAARAFAAIESGSTGGESVLRLALDHFDRIASQHEFQDLMQQEMVRFRRGQSDAVPMLVRSLYEPLLKKMQEMVRDGIRTGELCQVDWLQLIYAALGANIFYFLSAPIMRLALPLEPLDDAALASRRRVAIEFLGQTLFQDRSQGAKVAKRVLATTPMPATKGFPLWRKCS